MITKLFEAIQEKNVGEFFQIFNIIKKERTFKNILNFSDKKTGMTLLHAAAQEGLLDIVQLLIKYEANIDIKNHNGYTACDLAIQKKHMDIAIFLSSRSTWQKTINDKKITNIPLDKTFETLLKIFKETNLKSADNLVLVIGITGAGKGVLINYLDGCNYEEKTAKEQEHDTAPLCKTERAHVGRNSAVSDTIYPSIITVDNINLVDTAGFYGTRNKPLEIVGALSMALMIQEAKKVSILYLIDYPSLLTRKAQVLVDEVRQLDSFLQSQSTKYISAIKFVITKTFPFYNTNPNDICANRINALIKAIEEGINSDSLSDSELETLKSLCYPNNRIIVPNVFDKGKHRQEILRQIKQLSQIDSDKLNIAASAGYLNEFHEVTAYLASYYIHQANRINGIIPNEIIRQRTQFLEPVLNQLEMRNAQRTIIESALKLFEELDESREKLGEKTVISVIWEKGGELVNELSQLEVRLDGLEKSKDRETFLINLKEFAESAVKFSITVTAFTSALAVAVASYLGGKLAVFKLGSTAAAIILSVNPVAAAAVGIALASLTLYHIYEKTNSNFKAFSEEIQTVQNTKEELNKIKKDLEIYLQNLKEGKTSLMSLISSYQNQIILVDEHIMAHKNNMTTIRQAILQQFSVLNYTCLELFGNKKLFDNIKNLVTLIGLEKNNDFVNQFSQKYSEVLDGCTDIEKNKLLEIFPKDFLYSDDKFIQISDPTQLSEGCNTQETVCANGANQNSLDSLPANIIYDTNKRMSAARESISYQFFFLVAKSILSFRKNFGAETKKLIFSYQNKQNAYQENIIENLNDFLILQKPMENILPENEIDLTNTLSINTADNYRNHSNHWNTEQDVLFDNASWDSEYQRHPDTGKLIFTYRVFKDGFEVGSAIFYQHPLLCRSEDGARHNIISLNGVLADYDIEGKLQNIEDICEILPPTMLANITQTAIRSTQHGAIRGTANVVSHALKIKGFSEQISQYANYLVYYGGMFTVQYANHYQTLISSDTPETPETQKMTMAAYQAALDTGKLVLTQTVINQGCQLAGWLGHKIQQYGWQKTGQIFQHMRNYGGYGVYAYQACTQGPIQTGLSIASGVISEKTVETIGKYSIEKSLSNNGFFSKKRHETSVGENNYLSDLEISQTPDMGIRQ